MQTNDVFETVKQVLRECKTYKDLWTRLNPEYDDRDTEDGPMSFLQAVTLPDGRVILDKDDLDEISSLLNSWDEFGDRA